MTSIKSQIAAARALADAATEGPWENPDDLVPCGKALVATHNRESNLLTTLHNEENDGLAIIEKTGDAKFIAASRTLVPQLATLLERACELLAVCEGWISADTEDASHFVELAQVRAFLAGEVKP